MSNSWNVKLISESFTIKQNEYDCNSTFVIILGKSKANYDRDDLGELILDYEEWGCIDPPGPNSGFGGVIDPDLLQDNWDEECRAKLTIKKLQEIGKTSELAKQIFPYIDGIFRANEEAYIFEELPHHSDTLIEFFNSGSEDDFLEIIEYEDG